MPFDSDFAILGTGVAALVAASRLLTEGASVLLLNPEADFFSEDSELPLDPFWPTSTAVLSPQRLSLSLPENALAALRPDFPGAIEQWPEASHKGFHDVQAPHVRSRARLWLGPASGHDPSQIGRAWDRVEAMYVEASDAGLHPQLYEGLPALKRFPGVSPKAQSASELRGILIPRLCDFDVDRYRTGLLEFVRERLGVSRVVCSASQIELIDEGVRFHYEGTPYTARIHQGMLVFWTPRLTQWVLSQAKRNEVRANQPDGVRLWEQWSLVSKDPLDPSIVGMFEGLAAWAEAEGLPDQDPGGLYRLAVLRPGPLVPLEQFGSTGVNLSSASIPWASVESFRAISRLVHDLLDWEKFSVRSLRPRAIFEWNPDLLREKGSWSLKQSGLNAQLIAGCDGPLIDVTRVAREACERLKNPLGVDL